MDRRSFVRATGAAAVAGLTGILASGRAPAYAQGTTLHVLRWVDVTPAADRVLMAQMPEASKALGARIVLERIDASELQSRIMAAIETGQGPDVVHLLHNWAQVYARGLASVADVVEDVVRAQGAFYPQVQALNQVRGVWRGVPHAIVGALVAYRRSLFEEAGFEEFPRTWQQYRLAGKKLKVRGFPIGQTLARTFGDAPVFWYAYLWSWGGREVEADGRVAIDSPKTVESVKFAVDFWKDACDEGGLAWDDSSNNRAFLSGAISATLNPASIYLEARRHPDRYRTENGVPMHSDILHSPSPSGPAGAFHYHSALAHGVMSHSKQPKLAREFLRWLHAREQYEPWFAAQQGSVIGANQAWERHPVWEDPVMLPFRLAARSYRLFGHAGVPDARAADAYARSIVTDMYARAVRGMPAEDAAAWAQRAMKWTYEPWTLEAMEAQPWR